VDEKRHIESPAVVKHRFLKQMGVEPPTEVERGTLRSLLLDTIEILQHGALPALDEGEYEETFNVLRAVREFNLGGAVDFAAKLAGVEP
jgi:hypothetical protein